MAQKRPVTPEKQLLNLIEGVKNRDSIALDAHTVKHYSLSFLSLGAWLGRFSFLKTNLKNLFRRETFSQLDVKTINKVLVFCVIVLSFYLAINLSFSTFKLIKLPIPEIKFQSAPLSSTSAAESSFIKKAVSYYLEKIGDRDIFKMDRKVLSTAESSKKGPSSRIIEATGHLRLVGISWSNDPDAMIEDTKAMRTFFVKRGQMIGEIKVGAIFKDKVVLYYNNEEIEIQ